MIEDNAATLVTREVADSPNSIGKEQGFGRDFKSSTGQTMAEAYVGEPLPPLTPEQQEKIEERKGRLYAAFFTLVTPTVVAGLIREKVSGERLNEDEALGLACLDIVSLSVIVSGILEIAKNNAFGVLPQHDLQEILLLALAARNIAIPTGYQLILRPAATGMVKVFRKIRDIHDKLEPADMSNVTFQ